MVSFSLYIKSGVNVSVTECEIERILNGDIRVLIFLNVIEEWKKVPVMRLIEA